MTLNRSILVSLILWYASISFAQVFDILGDEPSIEIPFSYQSNFIIVKVKLNGTFPMNFIFDTGAEHTLLFKRTYTDLLQVSYDKKIKIFGSDLQHFVHAYIVRNLDIVVPPLDPVRMDFLVMEQDYLHMDELTGMNIDGILGAQFFKHHVVKIDYKRGTLTLYKKEFFPKPKSKFIPLAIQLNRNKPYISASSRINRIDSADLTLLLDTGAGVGLMLHSNTHDQIQLPENYIQARLGVGIGGQINGYIGRIATFNFSSFSFTNVITAFQDIAEGSLIESRIKRNGIIGNQILSRFTVIIDYPHSMIYLKPEKRFKQTFEYDKSGLTIAAAGPYLNNFRVIHVMLGSPADRAGIQLGDRIMTLNGLPTSFYNLNKLSQKLRSKVGKKIKMKVLRNDEKSIHYFLLEELL